MRAQVVAPLRRSFLEAPFDRRHGTCVCGSFDDRHRVNRERGRSEDEFELSDTGAFADGRYFDVQAEYAKVSDFRPKRD